uniref:ATP-binding protein n=1 Tax=Globodera pallida TaxID=36090 RepID=A0A183C5T3_GLOPA
MKRAKPSQEFPEIEFNVNTMGLTVYCPRHLKTPRLVRGFFLQMLNKLPKPFLIVYDDLMGEIDAKKLADLYTKKSHHNNFAVMFLTQNLFDKAMRVPRSNAQYIFLMRAPNDMLSIRNLATQIFPREQGFLIDAYKQACAEPYGGLVAAREKIDDDVTEQTNFGFVKQQLEKAKRKRATNVSEKKAQKQRKNGKRNSAHP